MNTRDIQERIAQIRKEHDENGGGGIACLAVLIWHDRLVYEAYYGNSMQIYKARLADALQWIEGQHAEFLKSKGKLPPEPPIEIIDPEPAEA